MSEYKVHIIPETHAFRTSVYLIRTVGEQTFIAHIGEDGKLLYEKINTEGPSQISPTFSVQANQAHALLTAFASALDIAGIENKTESRLAGELEATKKHLEDMRLLSKVPFMIKREAGL